MTKPYSLQELSARIHVILRRGHGREQAISLGDVTIHKENRMIHAPEQNIFLSKKEFALFLLLFENPNKRFSKEALFKILWPNGKDIGTVAVHVLRLRRKLESIKERIGTIESHYKSGYFFALPDGKESE